MIRQEYTGSIPELQGKIALTRAGGDQYTALHCPIVLAQFDEEVIFNGKRMHIGWYPFPAKDFTPLTGKPVF